MALLVLFGLSACTHGHGSARERPSATPAPGQKPPAPPGGPPTTEVPTTAPYPHHGAALAHLLPSGVGVVGTYDDTLAPDGHVTTSSHLFRTLDNGGQWRDVSPPDAREVYLDAVFRDALHGWAATWSCGDGKVLLHRTVDGGWTWRSTQPTTSGCHAGSGLALDFTDDRHGWMATWDPAANGGGLLRTTDGGASWVAAASPQQAPVTFVDAEHGWSAGGRSVPSKLFGTRDGGRSWEQRSVALLDPGEEADYQLPTFTDGSHGVLPLAVRHGTTAEAAFYVTDDGGATWSRRSVLPTGVTVDPASPVQERIAIGVAGPSTWWVGTAGSPPTFWVSVDGGRTWTSRRGAGFPESAWGVVLEPLVAVDARAAWAVACPLTLCGAFATRDGGSSWRPLNPPA